MYEHAVRRGGASRLLVVVGAIALGLVTGSSDASAQTSGPVRPPVRVCDNPEFLNGPAEPPSGAVVVEPGTRLSAVNDEAPARTTFWLAPGTHTLSDEPFDQVVPKEGNTYIGAPGAVLDGRGVNQYAFSQEAENVTISYLTVRGFVPPLQEGVVNHDSGDGWVIEHNTIEENEGAGIMGGSDLTVRFNCLRDNGQYGANVFQRGDEQVGILFDHNEIVGNNTGDWEAEIEGCGCTGGVKFWAATGVTFTNNWVHGNLGVGVWADTNNADFLLEGNLIEDNEGVGFFYETSYNAIVRGNVFRRNVLVDGPESTFPNAAIYLSEAGGDPVAPGPAVIDIVDNTFIDNWNGVTLWENADRFCGSPANTSSGYCTVGTDFSDCEEAVIGTEPNYSACRWKTQNVRVAGNVFSFDRAEFGCEVCGLNSILANWGSWPEWHPYQADVIQTAITTEQNNVFEDNRYLGDWDFLYGDQSTFLTEGEWRQVGQDVDSSSGGSPLGAGSLNPRRSSPVVRTYF